MQHEQKCTPKELVSLLGKVEKQPNWGIAFRLEEDGNYTVTWEAMDDDESE